MAASSRPHLVELGPWLGVARVVWLATGLAWAAGSLLQFAGVDYWSPVTTLDYVAVWSYTAGWLLVGVSIIPLGRLAGSRPAGIIALVIAIGAIVAGIANGLEDGLDTSSAGTLYVIGSLVAAFGMLALCGALAASERPRLAILPGAMVGGFFLVVTGLGGLIVLAAFGAIALSPSWFLQRTVVPTPDAATGTAG